MVRSVVVLVLVGVMAVPHAGLAQSQGFWDWVPGLPPGTRLGIALSNGSNVTGTFVEASQDTLVMRDTRPRGADVMRVARAEIASVNVLAMAKRLHTEGRPNAPAARHVIRGLGIGKTIQLSATTGSWKAKISRIGDDWFEISHKPSPVRIGYDAVRDIDAVGMSKSNKAAIAIGAGLGAFVGMLAVCYRVDCSAAGGR